MTKKYYMKSQFDLKTASIFENDFKKNAEKHIMLFQ